MKLIYRPFGIIMGLLAGIVGKKVFVKIWGLVDEEDPPKPTTLETNWPKLLAAAAVQGMVFRIIRVAVDRGGAKGYAHLTGVWPGEQRPDPQ